MLDILQAVFWSITYILLIVYAVKYKTHGIPLSAICLNYAWETVALIQSLVKATQFQPSIVIHIAWFTLDTVIVALFLFHETKLFENMGKKAVFLLAYAVSTVFLVIAFVHKYMLLSCFGIDLIMAIAFLLFVFQKQMTHSLLGILIGVTKLIGDMCAWLYYRFDPIVDVIGIIVLLCNMAYIAILVYKFFGKIKIKNRQEDEL